MFYFLNKGLTIGCEWFAWRTHAQTSGPAPSRTHPRPGLSGDEQSAQLEGRGIRRQQPRLDISTSWIYHWLKFNLKLNHQLAGKWHLKKGKPGPSQPRDSVPLNCSSLSSQADQGDTLYRRVPRTSPAWWQSPHGAGAGLPLFFHAPPPPW